MTDEHALVNNPQTLPTKGAALHPLVQAMLERDPTPETLREVLALQREWEADEAKKAYTQAVTMMREELPPVLARDKKVNAGRLAFTHTTMKAVMEAAGPLLTKYGFNLSWRSSTDGGKITVWAKLTHKDGHTEETDLSAPSDTSGSKNPVQAVGSTVTYLQRYTALLLLGITTADMTEDEVHAMRPKPDAVDSKANLRAMARATKAGKTKEEVEQYIGKPVQQWTGEDVVKLNAWLSPKKPKDGAITEDQLGRLAAWIKQHEIQKGEWLAFVSKLCDREISASKDLSAEEADAIVQKFEAVDAGTAELQHDPLRFETPPE